MTYTCKHCGKKVEALTLCGCKGALIEHYLEELDRHGWTGLKELTAENERLTADLTRILDIAEPGPKHHHNQECVSNVIDWILGIKDEGVTLRETLQAEITRLTAALVECQEARQGPENDGWEYWANKGKELKERSEARIREKQAFENVREGQS